MRPKTGRAFLAGLLVILAGWGIAPSMETSPAVAPGPEAPPPAAAPRREKPTYRVLRTTVPIVVDGRLNEETWEKALSLDLPYEVHPDDNVPSQVKTEAWLAYDDNYLYAAFRASDPDRSKIHARLSDRDRAFQDDFVGLVIDTFNDERRAFEFFVNPVGVQMDLVQDDVSGNEDSSWDAIWKSAGQITETGYVVEMAIPYTSLRFQAGSGDQTWGLDILRVYPRDRRFILALNRRDKNVSCYLCQISKVIGFKGATPGANIEMTPTLTAIRADEDPNAPGDLVPRYPGRRLERGDARYELGLTGKWGITPNLTASGALNPDFSQVEADAAQLNVNEAFALFFPEKRPFFLEGSDFFDTPMQAVYSRTVADPSWGAKVTGKQGRNVVGVFAAEDARTNLLLPGSQGSGFDVIEAPSTDAVVRYRFDLGKNSTIGALVTSRDGEEYSNRVEGVDTLLRPSPSDSLRFQYLASQTRYPDALALADGQPLGEFGDRAFKMTYDHNTKNWSAWARYLDLGRDFRADLGFIPQVNYRQPLVGVERSWWGGPGSFYSRIFAGTESSWTDDQDGRLLTNRTAGWFLLQGPRQSTLFLGGGHRVVGFHDAEFDQGFLDFELDIEPIRDITLAFIAGIDRHTDFAFTDPNAPAGDVPAREGYQVRFAPSVRYNLGRHVRFELSHDFRRLANDEGRLFLANLTELKISYQMTVRMFFRAILQYEDVKHDLSLYPQQCPGGLPGGPACPFDPRSRSLFSQLLFSYKINPQTAFFLGYTDSRDGLEGVALGPTGPRPFEVPLTRTARTFFFKLGYAWIL